MTSAEAKQRAALLEVLLERRHSCEVEVLYQYCAFSRSEEIGHGFAFTFKTDDPRMPLGHEVMCRELASEALRTPDRLRDVSWGRMIEYLVGEKIVPEDVGVAIETALEALS